MKPDYDGEDELLFAMQLEELNIKYDKQITFVIDKGFVRTNGKRYQDMKYTPDFMFKHNGNTYIVEIKGWSMFDKPIKYRLAEKLFVKLGYKYHKLKLNGSTADGTLGFYNYSSGTSTKKLVKKSSIKTKVLKQFIYEIGLLDYNNKEIALIPLKRQKKHTYEDTYSTKTNKLLSKGVFSLAEESWYKTNLDDTEMTNKFFEEFIKENYYIIGRGKDETKWKYIARSIKVNVKYVSY